MTAWVLVISKDYPDHWEFAQQDGFWDTRLRTGIEPGDDIFFWMSGTGLIGWVRATSATFELDATHPPAHWHDVATGNYRWRFTLHTRSSAPRRNPRWKEMATATGITVPASNGRIEVKDLAGQAYLRAQFEEPATPALPLTPAPGTYEPGDDLRNFAQRAVADRRGQAQFRDSLIDAYNGACAVTGSTVLTVLEAAHIDRYHGDYSNHVNNGLLLRSDLHTLFDFHRITVDDNLNVRVAPTLLKTEYGSHDGAPLKLPANPDHYPDLDALRRHRQSCSWAVPEPTTN